MQALFIDLDGTLADTKEALFHIYLSYLEYYGIQGTLEEFNALMGPSLPEIVKILDKTHGIEGCLSTYREKIGTYYTTDAQLFPGARAFLESMQARGHYVALVTAAEKELAMTVLEAHGVPALFDAVIVSESAAGKYKKALSVSGIDPKNVLALEDAPSGVEAALDAGIDVLAMHQGKKRAKYFALDWFDAAAQVLKEPCSRPINGSFVIREGEGNCSLNSQEEEQILALWERRPAELFAGQSFIANQLFPGGIEGKFCSYRYVYASRNHPKIRPVAVSGVTRCKSKFLLGQRGEVTQYSGYWELAPSGGIDTSLDYQTLIRRELWEETGIEDLWIEKLTPIRVAYSVEGIDICVAIDIRSDFGNRLPESNAEYRQFIWLDPTDIPQFLEDTKAIVPLSRHLLLALG